MDRAVEAGEEGIYRVRAGSITVPVEIRPIWTSYYSGISEIYPNLSEYYLLISSVSNIFQIKQKNVILKMKK